MTAGTEASVCMKLMQTCKQELRHSKAELMLGMSQGNSALHIICKRGHRSVLDQLLAGHAKVDLKRSTEGDTHRVRRFFEACTESCMLYMICHIQHTV